MNYKLELAAFRNYLEGRVSSGTIDVYLRDLHTWFSSLNGDEPTKKAAQSYVDGLVSSGKSPNTVNHHAHAIMRFFKWKDKPITLDFPTTVYKSPEYLTLEQIEVLLDHCKTAFEEVMVTVLFDTALRINELLNITMDDINWDIGLISIVGKGGGAEMVSITEKGLEALDKWLKARTADTDKVFMDLDYYYAWSVLRKLGERAGIPVHPHIFRHSRAIHMLMNGAEIYVVKDHLRHRNIQTTINIYGKFTAVHLKKLVPTW